MILGESTCRGAIVRRLVPSGIRRAYEQPRFFSKPFFALPCSAHAALAPSLTQARPTSLRVICKMHSKTRMRARVESTLKFKGVWINHSPFHRIQILHHFLRGQISGQGRSSARLPATYLAINHGQQILQLIMTSFTARSILVLDNCRTFSWTLLTSA